MVENSCLVTRDLGDGTFHVHRLCLWGSLHEFLLFSLREDAALVFHRLLLARGSAITRSDALAVVVAKLGESVLSLRGRGQDVRGWQPDKDV